MFYFDLKKYKQIIWLQFSSIIQCWDLNIRGRSPLINLGFEQFTQHVDDAFVVSSKQPYGVFKQQHESRVYHPVGQLVGVRLKGNERPDQNVAAFCCCVFDEEISSCTWKSSSASSWFWMMGRVLISFSVFMVRITPSALKQTRAHTNK